MKKTLRLLVPSLLVLASWPTAEIHAETTADVNIVFAFDQSDSMFNERDNPLHAEIQAEALRNFLGQYDATCVDVDITFFPWGTKVRPPTERTITSPVDAQLFWTEIAHMTEMRQGTTNHFAAFTTALQQFTDPSVTNVLVFTTDEATHQVAGYQLKRLVPSYVSVYAISLGDNRVYEYVEQDIVTTSANHFHATNSAEFKQALKQVMHVVADTFCLF